MRHGKVHGEGWVDGFLGIRRHKDVLQLRVEENVMHGMNMPLLCGTIAWEGSAPPPEACAGILHSVFPHGRHGKISGHRL